MVVLARELTSRGHSVTFIGFPDMRAQLPCDLHFASFGDRSQPLGSLEPHLRRLAHIGGIFSIRRLITDLASFAESTCRDLPALLTRLRPDALIIDQTDPAASLVAKAWL
jgi:UDP:flavonoid glycosyltransferase YjiC (YdhE family)